MQTGVWQEGVHDLLGYATDYAFAQQRGLQTPVLKSKHKSAYVRLHWNTVVETPLPIDSSLTRASRTRLLSCARYEEWPSRVGNAVVPAAPRNLDVGL